MFFTVSCLRLRGCAPWNIVMLCSCCNGSTVYLDYATNARSMTSVQPVLSTSCLPLSGTERRKLFQLWVKAQFITDTFYPTLQSQWMGKGKYDKDQPSYSIGTDANQ